VIRVGYLDLNSSFVLQSKLPATGGYASYTIGTGARQATADEIVLEGESGEEWLSTYPNPITKRYFTIRSEKMLKQLSIVHADGVEVFSTSAPQQEDVIDTQGWSKGLYVVKAITANGEISVLKIMK
jgi:hypothetical protein